MKSKKVRSVLRRLRKGGLGGVALVGAAFQQMPVGVGMVVSLGLHGVAMPSVVSWVQREKPTPPESVPVVELDERELAQLPAALREEMVAAPEESKGGWDWFTSRTDAETVPQTQVSQTRVPQTRVPTTDRRSRPSAATSERAPVRRRSPSSTGGESQGEFLSRWRQQLALNQRRADLQERRRVQRRSQQRSIDPDETEEKKPDVGGTTDGKEGTEENRKDGENRQTEDPQKEDDQNGDQDPQKEAGGDGSGTTPAPQEVPSEMPQEFRDRLATLRESPWEHDGRATGDREADYNKALTSDELAPWREAVIANQLKDDEGKVPADVKNQFWLTYAPESPLIVPVPSALRCTLSVDPDPVRVAMLGGPNGKFVSGEAPKLLTSSGYDQLDAQALELVYRNLRNVQLTPYQGYIIHLLTLSFPPCNSPSGGPTE